LITLLLLLPLLIMQCCHMHQQVLHSCVMSI